MFSFRKNNLDKIKSFIRNSEEIEIEEADVETVAEWLTTITL